jgi:transposase-like protein
LNEFPWRWPEHLWPPGVRRLLAARVDGAKVRRFARYPTWYRSRLSFSWRVDETYVRVKGRWKYLCRAIDKDGATLDFYVADRPNAKAAKRFLSAAPEAQPGLDPAGDQHG